MILTQSKITQRTITVKNQQGIILTDKEGTCQSNPKPAKMWQYRANELYNKFFCSIWRDMVCNYSRLKLVWQLLSPIFLNEHYRTWWKTNVCTEKGKHAGWIITQTTWVFFKIEYLVPLSCVLFLPQNKKLLSFLTVLLIDILLGRTLAITLWYLMKEIYTVKDLLQTQKENDSGWQKWTQLYMHTARRGWWRF